MEKMQSLNLLNKKNFILIPTPRTIVNLFKFKKNNVLINDVFNLPEFKVFNILNRDDLNTIIYSIVKPENEFDLVYLIHNCLQNGELASNESIIFTNVINLIREEVKLHINNILNMDIEKILNNYLIYGIDQNKICFINKNLAKYYFV